VPIVCLSEDEPARRLAVLCTLYSDVDDAEALTPKFVEVPTEKFCDVPSLPLKVKVPTLPPLAEPVV